MMIKFIGIMLTSFCMLQSPLNAMTSCNFFRLHPRMDVSHLDTCSVRSLAMDTDGDGVTDWKQDDHFGPLLFPNDHDADGDGVINILDPDPFRKGVYEELPGSSASPLPPHLIIQGPASRRAARRYQAELFVQSGIYAIEHSGKFSPDVLKAMQDILDWAVPKSYLPRLSQKLKYLFSFEKLGNKRALGLYLEPVDGIVVHTAIAKVSRRTLYETLAHEIGHAVLFASMHDASRLQGYARQLAGWDLDCTPDTLYDPCFLRRFSGAGKTGSFPSKYARVSIHEWFAENFAYYALSKLGWSVHIDHSMAKFFDRLLNEGAIAPP